MKTVTFTYEEFERILIDAYEKCTSHKLTKEEAADIICSFESTGEAIEERLQVTINIKNVDDGLFA